MPCVVLIWLFSKVHMDALLDKKWLKYLKFFVKSLTGWCGAPECRYRRIFKWNQFVRLHFPNLHLLWFHEKSSSSSNASILNIDPWWSRSKLRFLLSKFPFLSHFIYTRCKSLSSSTTKISRQMTSAQCENVRNILSLKFHVKSTLVKWQLLKM